MKTVVMIRHGKKQGELIAEEQLEEIRANGIPALNPSLESGSKIVICMGSGLERTAQTITAFMDYMESRGEKPTKILKGDPLFGNAKLFGQMTGDAELMAEQKIIGWYKALEHVNPELLHKIQIGEFHALKKIFESIEDNEMALTVGHTPMIELLGLYVDDNGNISDDLSLKELQGLMFQDDGDTITVLGLVG